MPPWTWGSTGWICRPRATPGDSADFAIPARTGLCATHGRGAARLPCGSMGRCVRIGSGPWDWPAGMPLGEPDPSWPGASSAREIKGSSGARRTGSSPTPRVWIPWLPCDHEGLGNELIELDVANSCSKGSIECRERLGGLLRYYRRAA